MQCGSRLHALLSIRLARRCPGPGCRWDAVRNTASESLTTPTVFTPRISRWSLISIGRRRASPSVYTVASTTSTCPVPRMLCQDFHSFLCVHTAATPTQPSSECNPSVHHIQTPAQFLAAFSLAKRSAVHLAAVVSSSVVVLTTGFSPGAG